MCILSFLMYMLACDEILHDFFFREFLSFRAFCMVCSIEVFCSQSVCDAVGLFCYFLPKSAGISPHCSVSHFTIGIVTRCALSHASARSMSWNSCSVSSVRSSSVLQLFLRTQLIAVRLSLYMVILRPCLSSIASACTMARNSPMLFVPCTGPK